MKNWLVPLSIITLAGCGGSSGGDSSSPPPPSASTELVKFPPVAKHFLRPPTNRPPTNH